jgi:hypothetical protein
MKHTFQILWCRIVLSCLALPAALFWALAAAQTARRTQLDNLIAARRSQSQSPK